MPYKALVAKRLAQCLDPTLPSGVHQKALEVYAYVFSTLDVGFNYLFLAAISENQLSREMAFHEIYHFISPDWRLRWHLHRYR